jgi:hypothetical protein
MAAAAMLEIQVHAIKWAITTRFLMKIGTQTKKNMLKFKNHPSGSVDQFSGWRTSPCCKFK